MVESLKSKKIWIHRAIIIFLFTAFLYINLPFVTPVVLAGIFALGLDDFINRLAAKKWSRKVWIWITLFSGFLLFFLPISLAIYRIVLTLSKPQNIKTDVIIEEIHKLQAFVTGALDKISSWTGTDFSVSAKEGIETVVQKVGAIVLNQSTQILGELPAIILATFVFLIALASFLFRDKSIKDLTYRYSPLDEDTTKSLIKICKKSCSITLFSTLVIGLIQSIVIGVGSLIFNQGDFWLVVTITFFVSFIPVIGAAPVGYCLSLLAFISDKTGSAIGLFIVATIAGTIDNILKPFLVSGDLDVHPAIGFTCVVGAIIMMGLPGLLIGPVIMNVFIGASTMLLDKDKNREIF